jgi:hypothetical protein
MRARGEARRRQQQDRAEADRGQDGEAQGARGRYKSGEAPATERFFSVAVSFAEDAAAFARFARSEEMFVLITNMPRLEPSGGYACEGDDGDPKTGLGPRGLLSLYEGQAKIENLFRAMKGPMEADRVFLETPKRIEAMMMLVCVAVLRGRGQADPQERDRGLLHRHDGDDPGRRGREERVQDRGVPRGVVGVPRDDGAVAGLAVRLTPKNAFSEIIDFISRVCNVSLYDFSQDFACNCFRQRGKSALTGAPPSMGCEPKGKETKT